METLYSILGILIGMLMVLITLGIVGMVTVWKKAVNTAKEIGFVWKGIDSLNRNLDSDIKSTTEYADRLHTNTEEDVKEIRRQVNSIEIDFNRELEEFQKILDSRLDKFENRLTKIFEDGCKPVQEK